MIIIDHPKSMYQPSEWQQIEYKDMNVLTNKSNIEWYVGDATML